MTILEFKTFVEESIWLSLILNEFTMIIPPTPSVNIRITVVQPCPVTNRLFIGARTTSISSLQLLFPDLFFIDVREQDIVH
jgi:hypothetical protein